MGRPAKFDTDQILDVTARIIADGGAGRATVAGIARELGAPNGSIYHRFESRDLLLARLWIRTVRRAQEGFRAALVLVDAEQAATEAALHVPRWSRRNLAEAKLLLLYRREDLAEHWPDELGEELAGLNTDLRAALRVFARRWFGRATAADLETTAFALIDIPYAATRRHLLAGKPPPKLVDDLVMRASRAVLAAEAP